ncbi:unnamed protein product [Cuscuta europaea]|uniref:Glabrous enhancer-binding protein-like DBD domain-containing protein n=1 Tax=Cuscuta europaea TaxID=41803 RepID=A0A9P0Z1N7_CUSEU|nr:unnamed protein product [Cuscuta europaea]
MAPESKKKRPVASSDEDATSYATSDEDEKMSEHEVIIDQKPESSFESEESSAESDCSTEEEDEGETTHAPPVLKPNSGQEPQSSYEYEESTTDSQETQAPPTASDLALLSRVTSKTTSTLCPNVPEASKQLSSRPSGKRALEAEKKVSQKKKPGAKRRWSEEDEIAILKEKIDYEAQGGAKGCSILFYDFMKDKWNVSVARTCLTDKLRRLKKNFLTLYEKGDVPTFDSPHESMVYELSEKIWGTSSNANAKSADGTIDTAKPIAKNANGEVKRLAEENVISHSMNAVESEAVTEKKKKFALKDKENEKTKKRKPAPEEMYEKTAPVEKDKKTAGKVEHNHSASKEKDSHTDKKKKKKRKTSPEGKDERTAVVEIDKQTAGKVEGSHSASKEKDSKTDKGKKKKKKKNGLEEKYEQTAVVEKDKHTASKGKDNQTDKMEKKMPQKTAPEEKDEQTDVVEKYKQSADMGKDNHSASEERYSQAGAKVNDGKGEANHGEAKNEEEEFQYKYPYLFKSFNKKNYPKSDQETLDVLKKNVILIDSFKAAELEEMWIKLWEQKVECCVKLGDMSALQARFMLDAMKR